MKGGPMPAANSGERKARRCVLTGPRRKIMTPAANRARPDLEETMLVRKIVYGVVVKAVA
ncbi:hypothetical protein [Nitrososphaera sp.]|uniref:hypothetical protein n=1 Tax=Nitrososphaera sp. TaxID=1971748 RepID=UPI00307D33BC